MLNGPYLTKLSFSMSPSELITFAWISLISPDELISLRWSIHRSSKFSKLWTLILPISFKASDLFGCSEKLYADSESAWSSPAICLATPNNSPRTPNLIFSSVSNSANLISLASKSSSNRLFLASSSANCCFAFDKRNLLSATFLIKSSILFASILESSSLFSSTLLIKSCIFSTLSIFGSTSSSTSWAFIDIEVIIKNNSR